MQVHVQPLGERLEVTPGDNLLKTLTERQIPISYSCLSGRCGTCRCRVLSGDVRQADGVEYRHHDEHSQGEGERHVLACQSTVHGDCEIELPEVDEVVVHPAKILKATVLAIETLTHDIKRLVLKPAKPLSFSPGQYATLQFTPAHIRPYSMAGLDADETLEFHIRRVPGEPLDLAAFRRMFAVARAGVDRSTASGEGWPVALKLSEGLPADLQGVFLFVAQAALAGAPCPPDATLARIYGSHSARRAARLLAYFEERDLLVARTDFHGRRVLAFPDLGCETSPGDPQAPDTATPTRDAAE